MAESKAISRSSHRCFHARIAFFFLGINKQLDLQSAMTELGRIVAFAGGWYEQRRTVQVYFVIGVAAACVAGTLILLFWTRKSPIQTWLALGGSTFVLGYVLIRAASFYHIDHFIGGRVLGLKWNWILEMTGIAIVLLASEWRRAIVFHLLERRVAR
jgi:ABC-type Mn2+/Zn2+ transport system permease subunit